MADEKTTGPGMGDVAAIVREAERLGNKAIGKGDFDGAERVFTELLVIDPGNAVGLNGTGIIANQNGDIDKAEHAFRDATRAAPDWAEPHSHLGAIYLRQGRIPRAIRALQRASAAAPDDLDVLYLLAIAQQTAGDSQGYTNSLRALLTKNPAHADANNDLGCVLAVRGDLDGAEPLLRKAAERDGATTENRLNLANVLLLKNQLDGAEDILQKILSEDPSNTKALKSLASVQRRALKLNDALVNAEKAAALTPDDNNAHNTVGLILRELGRLEYAEEAFAQSLEIDPSNPEARVNRAMIKLLRGDWRDGWSDYRARIESPNYKSFWGNIPLPRWSGENVTGKGVLVLSEQGFGDTINFCRFVPLLKQRCANVILNVQPELHRLIDGAFEDVTVFGGNAKIENMDMQVLLLDLPAALGIDAPDDVNGMPYLSVAEPTGAQRARVETLDGLKVGVNFVGNPAHSDDRKRTFPAEHAAALRATPGISCIDLHVGATPEEGTKDGIGIADVVDDFAGTAAIMSQLDLVITVDTATIHLAGALGVPCWGLLPFVPDWRWGLEGDDTPWYDSVRLFRQPAVNDWGDVLARVREALRGKVSA